MKNIYLIVLICSFFAKAQVSGCTDVQASNYDINSNINDGSCFYNNTSVNSSASISLPTTLLETSGMVYWNNLFWTHNDSADSNLYAVNTVTGTIEQTISLSPFINNDWEEISQDDNYIYIGDFGNNGNGNRTDLKILKIEKNSILNNSPLISVINFSYSNQTDFSATGGNNTDFDCEAFVVTPTEILLFTKQWVSQQTSLYSLSKNSGIHIATYLSTFNVNGLITGAVWINNKRAIVLSGYSSTLQPFVFLLYDFYGNNLFGGNKRKINLNLPFHQVEGICTIDELNFYVSNERYINPPFLNISEKINRFDLTPYLSNYYSTLSLNDVGDKFPNFQFNNPIRNVLEYKISPELINKELQIYSLEGKLIYKEVLLVENGRISCDFFAKGIYLITIEGYSIKFKCIVD